jgi:hypothetical protein
MLIISSVLSLSIIYLSIEELCAEEQPAQVYDHQCIKDQRDHFKPDPKIAQYICGNQIKVRTYRKFT